MREGRLRPRSPGEGDLNPGSLGGRAQECRGSRLARRGSPASDEREPSECQVHRFRGRYIIPHFRSEKTEPAWLATYPRPASSLFKHCAVGHDGCGARWRLILPGICPQLFLPDWEFLAQKRDAPQSSNVGLLAVPPFQRAVTQLWWLKQFYLAILSFIYLFLINFAF